jgi:uncharacterized protein
MTYFLRLTTPSKRALHICYANNFFSRLRGLLFAPALSAGYGLVIAPCNSVHTIGMTYAIDIVFMSSQGLILQINPALKPWRMARCGKAKLVLELASGQAAAEGLTIGQTLNLSANQLKTSLEGNA